MKIPANRFGAHLREPLKPCYLISGDEPLLVQEALDALRAAAREQGFDSRELHVQLDRFDWNPIAAAGSEMSLFASRRIVELRLPTGKPGRDGSAAIAELAAQAGDDLLFIVQTPKLDRKTASTRWVKALEAAGVHVQVWPVSPRDLPQWVAERMRRAGLKPDRDAVRIIADRIEGNLLAANQEIEKLRLLLGETTVTGADVRNAVADSSRFDVYQLADAALAGNPARALRILDGVRAEGVEPFVVVWALTRELRTLARLAEVVESGANLGAAMQKLRVWKTRQTLVRGCVARHRRTEFFEMIEACQRADAASK
ncbi:MAG: DNA polymerase III subunit delta, partial [Woeseiaceae bacterium]|nr:DNA polymerase III subunit delta [Woeseiaceae bacterium]